MKLTIIQYLLYAVTIAGIVFWIVQLFIQFLAITYGKYRLHKKSLKSKQSFLYPSVSIIKPLMGVDDNLKINLETFFTLNYPRYELLFCAEDVNDPSLVIVKELMEKYINIESRIFIGGSNVGVNPKINNMNPAYEAALYEMVVISDASIKAKPDTLLDMVEYMTNDVAYVHQMPYTCDRGGFAGKLEQIFFGTFHGRMYLGADLLGINCVSGMSGMIRKDVLDQVGGLKNFGKYLAEDFFIAQTILDKGWKTKVCSQPALQNSANYGVSIFQSRLIRWTRLRIPMVPHIAILEPLSNCLVNGTIAAFCGAFLFKWDILIFLLIHTLAWMVLDWILLSIIQNGKIPFNKIDFLLCWLYREIVGPWLIIYAVFNQSIMWRSREFKLAWGGMAYEITLPTKPV